MTSRPSLGHHFSTHRQEPETAFTDSIDPNDSPAVTVRPTRATDIDHVAELLLRVIVMPISQDVAMRIHS
jgi:hypothetical protein